MRLIDLDLLLGKVADMQACEPRYAFNFLNNAQNPSTEWCCIEDMLESMPIVEAQPVKHGQWTECWRDPERNAIAVICMTCGDVSHAYLPKKYFKDLAVDDVPKKIRIPMPYCPKCGARMDVTQ